MAPKKAAAKGKAGKGKKESPRGGDASTNVENLTNEIADRDLRIQDLLLDIARYVRAKPVIAACQSRAQLRLDDRVKACTALQGATCCLLACTASSATI